jgi:hypothetical protein
MRKIPTSTTPALSDLEALVALAKESENPIPITLWVGGSVISGELCSRAQFVVAMMKVWGTAVTVRGTIPDREDMLYLIRARYDGGLFRSKRVTMQFPAEIGPVQFRIASVDGWAPRALI